STSTATANRCARTTCASRGSCASGWRLFPRGSAGREAARTSAVFVFGPRRAPGVGRRTGHAQHAQHAQRAFLAAALDAAVVAGHEHGFVEAYRAVEAARRIVAGAQLEVHARQPGDTRRLEQPFEHALADAEPAMRRAHREQNQVRALLAELHDREAGERI